MSFSYSVILDSIRFFASFATLSVVLVAAVVVVVVTLPSSLLLHAANTKMLIINKAQTKKIFLFIFALLLT